MIGIECVRHVSLCHCTEERGGGEIDEKVVIEDEMKKKNK